MTLRNALQAAGLVGIPFSGYRRGDLMQVRQGTGGGASPSHYFSLYSSNWSYSRVVFHTATIQDGPPYHRRLLGLPLPFPCHWRLTPGRSVHSTRGLSRLWAVVVSACLVKKASAARPLRFRPQAPCQSGCPFKRCQQCGSRMLTGTRHSCSVDTTTCTVE